MIFFRVTALIAALYLFADELLSGGIALRRSSKLSAVLIAPKSEEAARRHHLNLQRQMLQ